MKIAIAGAGMSGAYLFRRLVNDGFKDIELFDAKKTNPCGSRPCAWGFAPRAETYDLIAKVADPESFELQRSGKISIDGIDIRSDMLTMNKPALIKEMIGDAEIRYGPIDLSKYDRIIDATGVSRAYLPPIKDDYVAECIQYKVRSEEPLGFWFRTSSVGYEWCFPLGGDEYHIGFGSLKSDVRSYRPSKNKDGRDLSVQLLCKCHSIVRLTAPFFSQPFVKEKIVGIGESIGAVAPLASDGNLYAMQCGEMLLEDWDDPDRYSERVLKRYDWMRSERKGLEKLMEGRTPSLLESMSMRKHLRSVGVEIKGSHILKFLRNMSK
ncbi:MAG: NAD(P)/FAD-dependent oxidoreductase [Methanomassiliicoccales archaeon]